MPPLPPPPPPSRRTARFVLAPSLGSDFVKERAGRLGGFLSDTLARQVEVSVAPSYEALAKDVLAGRVDAAWAPPFVCARLEAMGVRIAVRGVRRGSSSYRAALLARRGSGLTLEGLAGRTVAWVDQDSTAGYLLPLAFLRGRPDEVGRKLGPQSFRGSYQAALEAVRAGEEDLCGVFAGPPEVGAHTWQEAVELLLPGQSGAFELLGFTDESPNDGLAVAMGSAPELVQRLEQAFLQLHEAGEGQALLEDIFNAERFEPAPRMGYRALYRVALSSL